ncbi:S8 family serine peptidase [Euzebya tangerina]|uniref:S8 family serine peptidase n=1 Tax=Euzebya tangerina TaxID=591198 RepID=UPI000E31499D|nr:S8 family serine peptidase [Euzebya tangerina]
MSGPETIPAWAKESRAVALASVPKLGDLTPEWAWGGATGEGVRVAVVDSGIDADHPDLGECIDVERGVALRLDQDGDVTLSHGPHRDDFGHGTACAGIIHSLAPAARITSVKVLGSGLSGKAAVFLRGLAWCVEQGFDIINLSLGTTREDWALPFYEVCDRAYFSGSLIVTAASNVNRPSWPSLIASVTSVASNLSDNPERFHYNPEPPTEFLAHGVNVDVAWRGGERISGTGNSYAAPHIAGIAARIKSKHTDLRPFQLKTVLWATAANVQQAPTRAGSINYRDTQTIRTTGVFNLADLGA